MKSAKRKLRIYEVPISYHGRTYEEGKKIGWKDGLRALAVIFSSGSSTTSMPPHTAAAFSTISPARPSI